MGRIRLSNNMVITLTTPDTPELWDAYYDLRWRLLREPWQQPRGSEKDELEKEAYHCIAIDEHGSVIGVGRIHKQTEFIAQILAVKIYGCFGNV